MTTGRAGSLASAPGASAAADSESGGGAGASRSGAATAAIAWRNLWRNPRRTWLTAGGIAFAVWLLIVAASLQSGSFGAMVDNAARLGSGHLQLQNSAFQDDPRLEYLLPDGARLLSYADSVPGVEAALPRAQAFALVSAGERSFGAAVVGVDPEREAAHASLPGLVAAGRYLERGGEAYLGAALARNLGVGPGDEVVFLGSARDGGVAAGVARVVGTFETGQGELDRGVMQVPLDDFRTAWDLAPGELHAVVILARSADDTARIEARLAGPGHATRTWETLMPEARQTIELKVLGARFMFALVAVIVTLSVVNTFVMTVFERTREFGMLMALGMRPGAIVLQLRLEALWLSVLGIALGIGAAAVVIAVLAATGLPLPEDAAGVLARFNLPDRMYPRFAIGSVGVAAVTMLVAVQFAVWIPTLRIRRLRPVEALRARE
jgi:putative ABC transport system permease protein